MSRIIARIREEIKICPSEEQRDNFNGLIDALVENLPDHLE